MEVDILIQEIGLYLSAVDAFREEDVEPRWLPEQYRPSADLAVGPGLATAATVPGHRGKDGNR